MEPVNKLHQLIQNIDSQLTDEIGVGALVSPDQSLTPAGQRIASRIVKFAQTAGERPALSSKDHIDLLDGIICNNLHREVTGRR